MANSDSYTRHICQQSKTELYCEGSQVIKILRANYGRTDESVCSYSAPYSESPNTACSGPSALKVMRERCDGKKSCSVRSSNHVFANPCPGTRKYLEYAYSCVNCVCVYYCVHVCVSGSKLIHMLMANYGRSSEWVCTYSAPYSQPADTACGNPEASLQLMKDRCDGKHSCSLPASNHVFSNPCPGTKKYLEYSYTCVHT
uniref:SUEL-type lectin domain-containing protein n=1 Tax=Gouania willdenowi TaxID=441366 RepID=A0A8C5HSY8_GOUWI